MKFELTYHRSLIDNNIDVQIDAETGEIILGINCPLDSFEIASDNLSQTPVASFHRTFSQAEVRVLAKLINWSWRLTGSLAKQISTLQGFGLI